MFGTKRARSPGAATKLGPGWTEADGGTIFLDEIETWASRAGKTVRFWRTAVVRESGTEELTGGCADDSHPHGDQPRYPTSHRREGNFREDIVSRLNVGQFNLPQLRESGGCAVAGGIF